jgi:hypothetical protein
MVVVVEAEPTAPPKLIMALFWQIMAAGTGGGVPATGIFCILVSPFRIFLWALGGFSAGTRARLSRRERRGLDA